MFRALILALATLAVAPIGAAAQDRATPILEMLERLPMPTGEDIVEIDYGNPGPVRGAALMAAALGQMDDDPVLAPVMRTMPVNLGQRAIPAMDSLPETHGIDLLQVERFAMMAQLPFRAALLDLPDGAGEGVGPAIARAGLGYQETLFRGERVLWRGEDYETDLERRADVFGYGLGQSSRLWIDGDFLLQTTSWEMMEGALAAPAGSVGTDADAVALVAALDAGLDAPGQVAALRLYLDLPETYPGRAILVADMIHGARNGAVFAILTGDRAAAYRLAAAVQANWDGSATEMTRRTMAEMFSGQMQATVVEPGGSAILAVTVYGPRDRDRPFWQNTASTRFNSLLMAGEVSWLAP